MTSYFVVFLLFLLQFVYLPFGTSHFEIPKVYTAEFAIFLLFLFNQESIPYHRFKTVPLVCSVVLLALTIFDLFFLRTNISFFGNTFRLQGIFLLWMLLLFSVTSALLPPLKISRWFFLIILCVQCFFTFIIDGEGTRAIGTIGEPNALAAAIVFLWPFIFFYNQNKLYKISSILLAVLVILLAQSRSGIISLSIQLLFFFLSDTLHMSLKKTTIICLLLTLLSLTLPFFDQKGFYENRTQVWQSAFMAGVTHPILGNGFGNIQYALHASEQQFHNDLGLSLIDSSHNIFLDWFVQGGIVGLVIFFCFLYQAFAVFIQKKETLYLVSLLGILISLSFNPASIVTLVALFWLLGKGMI
ncbi:MAG: O-antigen ligase family protein [Candidatus Levyibacteriota bacterium]